MSRFRTALSVVALGWPMMVAGQSVAAKFESTPPPKAAADSGFAAYKQAQLGGFESYKEQVQREFREYAQLHRKVSEEYRSRVAEVWVVPEESSQTRWVQYEDGYQRKRVVDFENGVVTWSVPEKLADSAGLIEARAEKLLGELMAVTPLEAFEQDEVAREVEARSLSQFEHLETAKLDKKPVLPAYLFGDSSVEQAKLDRAIKDMVAKGQQTISEQDGQKVVSWSFPLTTGETQVEAEKAETQPQVERSDKPAHAMTPGEIWKTRTIEAGQKQRLPARARPFVESINRENSEFELSAELLLAIMETESAFNPMAKSPIPAFGLMQIVPSSAGQDATAKLFGKPKLLAPSYLYNAENNIRVGAAYFNILYYRYFKDIEDPRSRLYCAIAAYNTGPGNVSKALTGNSMALKPATRIANTMTPDEVYEHLLDNLPYEETVNYLRKVNARLVGYEKALADG